MDRLTFDCGVNQRNRLVTQLLSCQLLCMKTGSSDGTSPRGLHSDAQLSSDQSLTVNSFDLGTIFSIYLDALLFLLCLLHTTIKKTL